MGFFFKCPRSLLDSTFLENQRPVNQIVALVIVIAQAAYGYYWIHSEGGESREIRPGQFVVNTKRLQELTGWSKNKLDRFLFHLRDHGVLNREVWNGQTIATLNGDAIENLPPFPLKPKKSAEKS